MSTPHKLLIERTVGFTPEIGILVSTLARCRETTIRWVKNLTIHQLDYLYDENANSIGSLLLHAAAIEVAYQEYTFYGTNVLDNPEKICKWEVPMNLGEAARQQIRGYPVEYYLEEMQTVRDFTLQQFRTYDDEWLWKEADWNDLIANNYWMWYHVYEDEINHRGEISWLKSRIPNA